MRLGWFVFWIRFVDEIWFGFGLIFWVKIEVWVVFEFLFVFVFGFMFGFGI